ncbi:hypothetical protein AB0B25_02460 [Nocardia sp. NPDC049190]|uniref:hypothetical protein n=1 Tax=Nocardia sp. NPDC049190 TaxID=3155650 RepID=UPI0033C40D39
MFAELVQRLRGVTKGVAEVHERPLRELGHGLRRVSGIGQTDEEIAQLVRGIDVREINRNLIDGLDYHQLNSALEGPLRYERGDHALAQILRRQGFDGPPRLVDAQGMREAIDAGWIEMSRGVRRLRDVADFKTGNLFPGRGGNGSGTYMHGREPGSSEPDSTRLREMAEHWAGDPGSADPGGVIRMAMHPDALLTDLNSLTAKRDTELASIRAEWERQPENSARRAELEDRMSVLSDVGRYAAIKGYDAYRINDMHVWVVLNRTALIVEL